MTGRPQPRRITLGGREAVALTPQEYERLLASRRQIGGQSARVRALGRQMRQAEQLLRDIEALVTAPEQGCGRGAEARGPCATAEGAYAGGTGCLRCAVIALLRRHRGATS